MRRPRVFPHEGEIYKSKYELQQASRLLDRGIPFEYEKFEIKFLSEIRNAECLACGSTSVGKHRIYTPDFYLNETKVFVETKGKFDAPTRTKMKEVCAQSPYDIRMVFMRDNWLTRKHKMTYGRWCDLHNIKWAVGDIPVEWGK